ncbi:MAG TPA: relaxase, partial [Hanamia sp.]|nr:relaxase [Hanamia sp.]
NESGLIYGITYVDHYTKCVFSGSALGKQYSAKAIQGRCLLKNVSEQESLSHHPALKPPIGLQSRPIVGTETEAVIDDLQPAKSASILNDLLQPEQAADWLPKQLKRKRKRKKRKNISDN